MLRRPSPLFSTSGLLRVVHPQLQVARLRLVAKGRAQVAGLSGGFTALDRLWMMSGVVRC